MITTVISELARNILQYAVQGEILLEPVIAQDQLGLTVEAKDSGPGIPNVLQAMEYGYSSSGKLGLGLPGVKRLMDEFSIRSEPGQGTMVTAKKWKR